MGKSCRTFDSNSTIGIRARQTDNPLVAKIVGELRSPRPRTSSAVDPVQSLGSRAARRTGKPNHKDGRRRSATLYEDLVMDASFVGIDVSKDTLDGAFRNGASFRHDNSTPGIAKIVKLLSAQAVTLVVAEATGGLEVPLMRALQKAGLPVAVVNPLRVREFAKATGTLAKTDRIDAAVLAHFA